MNHQGATEVVSSGDRCARAERLRVLIVAPSLDMFGCQAVQAARLVEGWRDDKDFEVSLLPINPRLPGPIQKLQAIKYLRTVVTSLYYLASLLSRVRHYDVIHVFSASYLSFVLAPAPAILVAKLYGKKTVLNYRSGEAEDHLQRWRRTALPILRLADVIVAPSRYLVDVFARFGLEARWIFNIVDTERFRFRDRRPLRPLFLSNRNFEPLYNVSCVLKAFAVIQTQVPDAQLLLVGDGSERAKIQDLARELELKNTQFVGNVPPERMPELYQATDIYLNGSDIDNMPGSIIESYASGLPVVTTDAGGIPYIVTNEQTGLMAHRRDHEALAACAIRLLQDQDLASGIIARAHAECQKYSWPSVRSEWRKLYNDVANQEPVLKGERTSGSEVSRLRVDG